ncbi:MAG TPA: sigma-70 family RNA polymerase sigma factor [Gaiellaceae bacterium]|nr:sigma-70 family RNA polymerase sigma factor [Gaiellaceae bacterium]
MPDAQAAGHADLIHAVKGGDAAAEQRLVALHLPLVRAVAARYAGLGLPLEDLVQEGCLGVLAAARRWDPDRGVPFESYARFRVRVAIRDELTARSRLIRLPKHVVAARAERGSAPRAVLPGDDRWVDAVADGASMEDEVVAHEEALAVDRAVGALPARQRLVIEHRFGLDGAPEPIGEVARELRLSRGRTIAIERQALHALRRALAGLR